MDVNTKTPMTQIDQSRLSNVLHIYCDADLVEWIDKKLASHAPDLSAHGGTTSDHIIARLTVLCDEVENLRRGRGGK